MLLRFLFSITCLQFYSAYLQFIQFSAFASHDVLIPPISLDILPFCALLFQSVPILCISFAAARSIVRLRIPFRFASTQVHARQYEFNVSRPSGFLFMPHFASRRFHSGQNFSRCYPFNFTTVYHRPSEVYSCLPIFNDPDFSSFLFLYPLLSPFLFFEYSVRALHFCTKKSCSNCLKPL